MRGGSPHPCVSQFRFCIPAIHSRLEYVITFKGNFTMALPWHIVITIITIFCFCHKHHNYPNHKLELAHFHFTGRIRKYILSLYSSAHSEPHSPAFIANADTAAKVDGACPQTWMMALCTSKEQYRTSAAKICFYNVCLSSCLQYVGFCAWQS